MSDSDSDSDRGRASDRERDRFAGCSTQSAGAAVGRLWAASPPPARNVGMRHLEAAGRTGAAAAAGSDCTTYTGVDIGENNHKHNHLPKVTK